MSWLSAVKLLTATTDTYICSACIQISPLFYFFTNSLLRSFKWKISFITQGKFYENNLNSEFISQDIKKGNLDTCSAYQLQLYYNILFCFQTNRCFSSGLQPSLLQVYRSNGQFKVLCLLYYHNRVSILIYIYSVSTKLLLLAPCIEVHVLGDKKRGYSSGKENDALNGLYYPV